MRDAAYDKIDRFLRNNLDDMDYAEYGAALGCLYDAAPPPAADAVTEAMVEAAGWELWGAPIDYVFAPAYRKDQRDKVRAAIAAALAARSEK